MLTTITSVLRHAADRMRRRHAYDVLHGASDHMLRDIGVTREDLFHSVMRVQR